jgi:hypothetical protein
MGNVSMLKIPPRHEEIVKAYKAEIFDWCGHDLAIELAAEKLGITRVRVLVEVLRAGCIW